MQLIVGFVSLVKPSERKINDQNDELLTKYSNFLRENQIIGKKIPR